MTWEFLTRKVVSNRKGFQNLSETTSKFLNEDQRALVKDLVTRLGVERSWKKEKARS